MNVGLQGPLDRDRPPQEREAAELGNAEHRLTRFMCDASLEVTPHDWALFPRLVGLLPAGTAVYIAHTPKCDLDDVVGAAVQLQRLGFAASPHLVARRITGEPSLHLALERLRDGGVRQALLVAGDCNTSMGPYADTLDIITSGILSDYGLERLGVAGHPGGHPHASKDALFRSLSIKRDFGKKTGIAVHVVTQFGFNPQSIVDWMVDLVSAGIDLPPHVGIPGPTSLVKLLRFAMQCGIGASMAAATKHSKATTDLLRHAVTPEQMVPALVQLGAGSPSSRLLRPHFYSFGSMQAAAEWIQAVRQGKFVYEPNGTLKVQQ